jgi:hypothetical protein
MFDTARCPPAATASPPLSPEAYTVEIAKLLDGHIRVALIAVTIEEDAPHLLAQEIATESVGSIDEALAIVKAGIRFT